MAKTVTFDVEARQALKKGIDIVASSVRITLGPKGRNVVLEKKFGAPTVTNDGVTIVREIELKDAMENTGAQLLRACPAILTWGAALSGKAADLGIRHDAA